MQPSTSRRPLAAAPLALVLAVLVQPAALAEPPTPVFKVTGYDRVRVMSQFNYDLNGGTPLDAWQLFTDIRSHVGVEAAMDQMRLVGSADLAGTDWDEGALMGNDNPARQRPYPVMVRQLFLEYRFAPIGLTATVGRQPSRLGHGLVASINRDSFKLAEALPDFGPFTKSNVTAVAVRGAKGLTQWSDYLPGTPGSTPTKGQAATLFTNDTGGNPYELDTYVLAWNSQPMAGSRLQAFAVQQIDTTSAGGFPMKRYFDLNCEGAAGAWRWGAEAVYMGGQGPTVGGVRPALDANALYGWGRYALGNFDLGLSVGRGTGDNTPADGVNSNFQSLFIDESSLAYNHLFGDDLHGYDGTDASTGRGVGLANITFLQPTLGYRFSTDLTGQLSYTKHLATAPQKAGAGVMGQVATTAPDMASDVGDEVDARLSYTWGATTFYGAASTFIPGTVYANPGFANAAHKAELGTEFRF